MTEEENNAMKKKIHPQYKETTITCACGEVIHTRSTKQNIKIDICSKCHPFFTGKQKLVDAAGMVDKFKKRYAKAKQKKATEKQRIETVEKEEERPQSHSQPEQKATVQTPPAQQQPTAEISRQEDSSEQSKTETPGLTPRADSEPEGE